MSQFCTSCGAQNSGSSFCTSCGTSLATDVSQSVSSIATPSIAAQPLATSPMEASPSNNTSEPKQKRSTKRKVLLSVLGFVLIVGGSVGGFVAGKASIDLKKERSVAFDTGYQEGNLNGYTNGNDEGYKQGYKDGCYYVFTKIGPNLIAIESPFYASDIYGYYWTRSEVCK